MSLGPRIVASVNQITQQRRPRVFENKGIFIRLIYWTISVLSAILSLCFILEIIQLLLHVVNPGRPLNSNEIQIAKIIFGNTIDYDLVRVRENSKLAEYGAKNAAKTKLGFVLGNLVSFSGTIDTRENSSMNWLIHELTHVAQYRVLGPIYMYEALYAQAKEGYRYNLDTTQPLRYYNLEQQAEIASQISGQPTCEEELYLIDFQRSAY